MESVGIRDTYAESAAPDELMEKYGLTAPHIVAAVQRVIERKYVRVAHPPSGCAEGRE